MIIGQVGALAIGQAAIAQDRAQPVAVVKFLEARLRRNSKPLISRCKTRNSSTSSSKSTVVSLAQAAAEPDASPSIAPRNSSLAPVQGSAISTAVRAVAKSAATKSDAGVSNKICRSSQTSSMARAMMARVPIYGALASIPVLSKSLKVGLYPITPQQAAGRMIDPEVRVPRHSGTMKSATAAAEPDNDPPSVWAKL